MKENGKISKRSAFTLIEIVISVGILTTLAGFGLFVAVDQYKNYVLTSERNTVVSLLQKARGRALNNISEKRHGVAIQPTGKPSSYVLFRGLSYSARDPIYDEEVPVSQAISFSGITEFTFKQLSGDALTAGTVTISTTEKSLSIAVNSEGRITW